MKVLQDAWQWFVKAMFPSSCIICRKEGCFLCQKHHHFHPAPPSQANFIHLDDIRASVSYDDKVCQKLVEYFKFRGISDIAQIMSEEIINCHQKFLENSIIVPIPLHWTRKIWRGFNQSEILAQKIVQKIPTSQVANILKRQEKTKQQAKLSRKERIKNTKNAFVVDKNPAKFLNKKIILIDDVVASGATLDSAAKALKRFGFKKVQAVVFARGGKK